MDTFEQTLDPNDWQALRAQGHRMLDDMLDYLAGLRDRPVWQPMPERIRDSFQASLDGQPISLEAAHHRFMTSILPYAVGNAHPGFMGWVHGGGTPVGLLAEILAAGLNANVGGRAQAPIELERQLMRWVRDLFNFPETANGLFVSGTSMANFISVLIARNAILGQNVRNTGLVGSQQQLVAYTSSNAHISMTQALEMAGIGSDFLRKIPVDSHYQIDIAALNEAIANDRQAGLMPFLLAATAGSADVGAIDPLTALADISDREQLWFHIDGAFGALGKLSATLAPRLQGIERADSLAFDFHKWLQVPYDAGFVLIRDGAKQLDCFASPASYLLRETQGLGAGSPWPCDMGPELSRNFKALKTWFTLAVYGEERLGQTIAHSCELAQYLKTRIENCPALELLAPVSLNIVCFRFCCADADRINAQIVIALQESGIAAPSTAKLHNGLVIRAAIVNHRTTQYDLDALLDATLRFGTQLTTHPKTS